MSKFSNSWKRGKDLSLYKFATEYWQRTYPNNVVCDFVSYAPNPSMADSWRHELHIRIPNSVSITGMDLHINCYTYISRDVDNRKVDEQCEKILRLLVKKMK